MNPHFLGDRIVAFVIQQSHANEKSHAEAHVYDERLHFSENTSQVTSKVKKQQPLFSFRKPLHTLLFYSIDFLFPYC